MVFFVLLLLIVLGIVAIMIITVRQVRNSPENYPVVSPDVPSEDIMRMLLEQRSATAVLKDGISSLLRSQDKILVVNGDLDTRLLWRLHFKKETRYAFFFAQTGVEGLRMMDHVDFDMLIFSDELADIDGDSFVDAFLSRRKIPCILMSSERDNGILSQKALTLNIPIISKPVNFPSLATIINHLFLQESMLNGSNVS